MSASWPEHPAGRHPVADATEFLSGSWDIQRTVTECDAPASGSGEFIGTVSIEPSGTGLVYREQGTLRWQSATVEVSREYLLRSTDHPAVLDWYFDHGGFFHRLDLRAGSWQAEHPCAADLYRAEYRVLGPQELSVIWRVHGSAKHQLLSSRWTRC
ncbi:DUF6314 family protein [Acaricomes phytoseiuli]|uniref:DUF6314 family protein n=1 Tax=Acaricomes phytoseiuli TaxID=291968 RepID=UPI002221E4A5|nr:DUF6314 family protein [Acaricomes phytoseiuli]MCW1249481.1 DUF6314 family protein [Acaricomes phytoseiuli]